MNRTGYPNLPSTVDPAALVSSGTNSASTAIFDRWGNLFADTPKLQPASGVSLNATGPGQSLNTSTDARGGFALPKLAEGVHQLRLDIDDLDNRRSAHPTGVGNEKQLGLRSTGMAGPNDGGPQALSDHLPTRLYYPLCYLVIAVPGTGNQSVGFAREIPQGTRTLQVKVSVDRNGNVKAVDLGDGAGLVDVSRGKVLPGSNRGSALVGRVALLQN